MPIRLGLGLSPVLFDRQIPWTPGELSDLRAWYDAELGQPKNVGYVQLDGTSGDYIFTPDSAVTSFSNDIEVVMRVKVTDWTAAGSQTLAGKYVSSGNQRSWRFYVNSSGNIGLSASTNGTAVTTVTVTPTVALPDATWVWLRMRLDLTDGANSVGTLETAADDGTNVEPGSWTANGTNTSTTIASVFDSTAPTEIGTFAAGTLERLSGQVGRCIVRAGFDGTTVADFNASDCYGDGYWHADGYRWNLGLPKIYDRGPNGLAPATFGSGSNQPRWLPWSGRSQVFVPGGTFGTNKIQATVQPAAKLFGGIEWEFINCRFPVGTSSIVEGMGPPSDGGWAVRLTGGVPYIIYADGTNYIPVFAGVTVPVYLQQGTGCLLVRRDSSTGVVSFFVKQAEADTYSLLDSVSGPTGEIYNVTYHPEAGFNINGGVGLDDGLLGTFIMRNGFGGPVVMKFDATLCGQDGYLDEDTGHDWEIYRPTTGRKIVVQSPVAVDDASSALLGTDDVIIGPAAAVPSAPSEWSIAWVGRRHESADDWAMLMSTGNNAASTSEGAAIFDFGSGSDQLSAMAHDGSGVNSFNSFPQDITRGTQTVATLTGDASDLTFQVNGDPQATVPAPGGVVNMTTLLIGRATDGGYSDSQWRAAVVVDRILTATEHGLLTAYYRGGL